MNWKLFFCFLVSHNVLMLQEGKSYLHQDEYVLILKRTLASLIAERMVLVERFNYDKWKWLLATSPLTLGILVPALNNTWKVFDQKGIRDLCTLYSVSICMYLVLDIVRYIRIKYDIKAIKEELDRCCEPFNDEYYSRITFSDSASELLSLGGLKRANKFKSHASNFARKMDGQNKIKLFSARYFYNLILNIRIAFSFCSL